MFPKNNWRENQNYRDAKVKCCGSCEHFFDDGDPVVMYPVGCVRHIVENLEWKEGEPLCYKYSDPSEVTPSSICDLWEAKKSPR